MIYHLYFNNSYNKKIYSCGEWRGNPQQMLSFSHAFLLLFNAPNPTPFLRWYTNKLGASIPFYLSLSDLMANKPVEEALGALKYQVINNSYSITVLLRQST